MTEDKPELDHDILPPFPWRLDGRVIFDAEDKVVIGETCGAPTDAVASAVVECMNQLAADGWLEPVTEFMEKLYNDLTETTNAFVRADQRNRKAIEQIEKFRQDGIIKEGSTAVLVDLQTPAELLDILHDVLSGGGSMTYFPCQFAVIPNIGDDGMCVAHATEDFDGKRYCRPHAKALEERWGASL